MTEIGLLNTHCLSSLGWDGEEEGPRGRRKLSQEVLQKGASCLRPTVLADYNGNMSKFCADARILHSVIHLHVWGLGGCGGRAQPGWNGVQ